MICRLRRIGQQGAVVGAVYFHREPQGELQKVGDLILKRKACLFGLFNPYADGLFKRPRDCRRLRARSEVPGHALDIEPPFFLLPGVELLRT